MEPIWFERRRHVAQASHLHPLGKQAETPALRSPARFSWFSRVGARKPTRISTLATVAFATLAFAGSLAAAPAGANPAGAGLAPVSADFAPAGGTGSILSFRDDAKLARRRIFDIAFEQSGTAWVAASDGLYRYDGYRWQRFSVEHGLPSVFVRSVLVTRAQTLWVGTDKGAGTFDGATFTLLATDKALAGSGVRRIVEDPDGTVWFCNDMWPDSTISGGLTSLKDGVWKRYGQAEGLEMPHLLDYFRDSEGRQFAMCNEALGVYQKKGDSWVRSLFEEGPVWSMGEVRGVGVVAATHGALCVLRDGEWHVTKSPIGPHYLITTRSGEILASGQIKNGLIMRKWNGRSFEPISPPIPMGAGRVQKLREAPDGSIWGVGDDLIFRWDRSSGEWQEFRHLPPPRLVDHAGRTWFVGANDSVIAEGERFTRIAGIAENVAVDRHGAVWSWSARKIRRWSGEQTEIESFDPKAIGLETLLGCIAAPDGLWAYGADHEHRPAAAHFVDGEWRLQVFPADEGYGISSAAADPRDGIWLLLTTNFSPELNLVRLTDRGRETHTMDYGGARYGPPRLVVDARRGLWVYGQAGVTFSATGRAGDWRRIEGVGGSNVLSATLAGTEPWFVFDGFTGGQNGFGVLRDGAWQQRLADVTGFATASADGTVYVSVPGSLFVIRDGDLRNLRQLTLPAGGDVVSLVQAENGLWVGIKDSSGKTSVWRYRPDGVPPATLITLGMKEVSPSAALRAEVFGVERFQPYRSGRQFRFSWRFDDAPWSAFEAFPLEGISVAALKPGAHRLEVRAQDEGLDIDPVATVAAFVVTPVPLQLRSWFRSAVLAILVIIAGLGVVAAERAWKFARANATLRTAQAELRRAHDELERRVEERTTQLRAQIDARQRTEATIAERSRLGQELHDSLEQILTSVALQLEATGILFHLPESVERHLRMVRGLLRQSQTEVRRAVQDLRAQVLENHDLAAALRRQVQRFGAGRHIRIGVESAGEARRLPPEVEHNLFRIGQEAIANALKHSGGDKVMVRVAFEPERVALSVQDNGRGCTAREQPEGEQRFGVLGMQERAKRLGGQFAIDSTPRGTTVTVVLRMPANVAGSHVI